MKFSKKVVAEAERIYGNSEYKYIVDEVKNGNAGVLRSIQESISFPYRFIENMINNHGKNAMSEIKAFLDWQMQVNDVYRDNYYELERARTENGGLIRYSSEFVEKVKTVFHNKPYIIELAENNSYSLRRMIDEERAYINVEGMLKTIEQKGEKGAFDEFKARTEVAKDMANLYSMCYDEYDKFVKNQSEPSVLGE